MAVSLLLLMMLNYGPFQCLGPEGGEIKAVIQSPVDSNLLYGMSGTNPTVVVRSSDKGLNWEPLSTFTGSTAYDMIFTADGTLLALGSSRVWRSTDGGLTWVTGSHSNTVFWLGAAHPTDGSLVYATGYKWDGSTWRGAFYRSTDGGVNWSSLYLGPSGVSTRGRSIAVSPSHPNYILVGGYKSDGGTIAQLWGSTDGGDNFTDVTPPNSTGDYYFEGIAFHPTNPAVILAGAYLALHRTTDGGSTWSRIVQYYNYGLSFSPVDNNLVLGAGLNRTYRSTNGGASWTNVTTGFSGSSCKWIVPDSDDASLAYTGSTAGFFRSTTGGASWTQSNSGLLIGNVVSMAHSNGYVWANLATQGLFRMEDSPYGTWEYVSTPSNCGDFVRMATNGGDVILGLEGSG